MTFFELNEPLSTPAEGVLSRVKRAFGNTIRSMQYARMLQALSELSDAQLDTIGIARADIPRFAREIVFDPHA